MGPHYDLVGQQLISLILPCYGHLLPRGETTPARFAALIAAQYSLETEQNRVVHAAVLALNGTFYCANTRSCAYRAPEV